MHQNTTFYAELNGEHAGEGFHVAINNSFGNMDSLN